MNHGVPNPLDYLDRSDIPRALWDWRLGGSTGMSSLTIWSVLTGIHEEDGDGFTPADSGDFGRCYRLLSIAPPMWRTRLGEVAARHPRWAPLVAEWDRLTKLYEDGTDGVSVTEAIRAIERHDPDTIRLGSNVFVRVKIGREP